jgi:hypothetical protein
VGVACLEQDGPVLKEMGVPRKKRKQGVWTHRVAILVENAEHARTLAGLLPGWEVLDTVPTRGPVEDEGEVEPGVPLTSGSIITWMHALRHDVDADYLVRATGWRGRIGMGGEDNWLKRRRRGVTVVDFDDRWDERAGMDTRARVGEYKEQGLEVIVNREQTTPSSRSH